MSEPRLEDDVAYYGGELCDDCGTYHDLDLECAVEDDPDRLHDEMNEWG